jgi:6-phosphofructokinase 2
MHSSINYQAIVSLSLNPAIDLTYKVSVLKNEEKSRASTSYFEAGGTGINVGRALEKLKANSHTCYLSAGKTGEILDSLINQQLSHTTPLRVDGETRINTTILQQSPQQQYQINANNFSITPAQLEEISEQFLTLCGQGFGILTGSLPIGISDSTYQRIDLALQKQGGRSIIDAPAHILKKSLRSKPFMIKPNLHELECLCNKSLNTIEHIAVEARQLVRQGTAYVCVSLGKQGALLSCASNSYYCNSPAINVHSTVGAGDSVVAGLAYAFAQNKSPPQALKLAVACGAGTAKQPGTQLFDPEELDNLSDKIDISTLDI